MSTSRIISVVGATGAQGGGLVRAILADPASGFRARAITRKASGDKAAELRKLGAEVVEADLDDEASLAKAFEGAYGAYCVTNYWEHFTPAKEVSQARNMAQAAKAAKLQHVIWSTLEDTRKRVPLSDPRMPTLMEKYKVPHFDAKGDADALFAEAGVPTTYLLTAFYWENFIYFGMGPKKGPDGKFTLTLPMGQAKLSGIAAEDIGKCAYGIFKQGGQWIGQRVGIAGDHVTGVQIAADDVQGARQGGRLQRGDSRGVSRLRIPGRGRPRQHVPVLRGVRAGVRGCAQSRHRALAEPGLCSASRRGWPNTAAAFRSSDDV